MPGRLNIWISIAVTAFSLGLCPPGAFATVRPSLTSSTGKQETFPTDPFVRRQVKFWELIFQKYPSTSVVIHDADDPSILIDVIEFDVVAKLFPAINLQNRDMQQSMVQRYVQRYQMAVESFRKAQEMARGLGPIEERVYQVYSRSPQSLRELLRGTPRIRPQAGLADRFLEAAATAQEYLPYMENTFSRYGVPTRLTRVAFVESMFNVNARSKVGASGIWQFMPDTAKQYMYVETFIDERNSPYKATKAAAQLLLENYRELRSWPLAVTAYNHGRNGMQRAKREIGTKDLGKIIQNFRSSTFGFASRNFYAEFLAAANTYDLLKKTNKISPKNPFIKPQFLALPRRTTVQEILSLGEIPKEILASLNPCLLPNAFERHINTLLPENYEIRIPEGSAKKISRKFANTRPRSVISRR